MTNADYNPEFDPVDVDSDYGSTGGNITVPTFNQVKPFRFWCQKALPLVYDDSLSYYELLCRVVAYLNNMMTDLNTATSSISEFAEQFVTNQTFLNNMAQQLGDNTEALEDYINERMEDFSEAYQELEDYVNAYFNNLDVQEEINNKLDEMSTDGTFDEIFLPFVSGWLAEKTEQIDTHLSNQNQTLATQNGKIAVLEGRMDTFSQLPSGSTSANAELADIRTNFLGVTFANAGDAVRTSDFIASGYNSIPVEATVKELFLDGSEISMNDDFSTYSVDITPFKGGKLALIFNAYNTFDGRGENGQVIYGKSNVMTPATDGCTTFDLPVGGSLSRLKALTLTDAGQTTRNRGYKYLLILPIPANETYRYYYLPYTQFGEGDPSDPSYVYPPDGTYLPNRLVYATSWYATPVDATLTHAGEAADAKATGDALGVINERLDDIVDIFSTGEIELSIPSDAWKNGYTDYTGLIKNSAVSKFALVPLRAGQTIVVGTQNTNITIIGSTTASSVSVGDTITVIQKTSQTDQFEQYSYTAETDINIVISVRFSNYIAYITEESVFATKEELEEVAENSGAITVTEPTYETTETALTKTEGAIINNGVVRTDYTTYEYSQKLSVSEGDVIKPIGLTGAYFRWVCAYNGNNAVSASGASIGTPTFTVPSGIDGVVVTISKEYSITAVKITRQTGTIEKKYPISQELGYFNWKGSLSDGDDISLLSSNVQRNVVWAFTGHVGTMGTITIGNKDNSNNILELCSIDATNIYYNSPNGRVTAPHGLTITDDIMIRIDVGTRVNFVDNITIISHGETYTVPADTAYYREMKGSPYLASDGASLTDCAFSWIPKDIDKPIWVFGDSWASMYDTRWLYYMVQAGYTNAYMVNAFAGEKTNEALVSLKNLLSVRKPDYIVWMMGMNNGDSNDVVNTVWKNVYDELVSICTNYQIELILYTVPNTPTIDNNYKNAIVRNSGYRYIDGCAAVGDDGEGNWFTNYNQSSTDYNHTSARGAKALMMRVITDFPEIAGNSL